MTVSSTINKASHTGNGSVVSFAYTFRMDNDEDMEVYLDEIEQPSGFTVNRNPDNIGGTVDFDSAPVNDVKITLLRVIEETQETDYTPYDAFPAEAHEDALDKQMMVIQQHTEELDRAIKASIDADPSVSYEMPSYDAGKVISWSSSDPKELVNSDFPLQTYVDDAAHSANLAEAAEVSAQALALSAQISANAASSDATSALASKDASALSETAAELARDFANDWATEAEDVLVDDSVNPTDYSAYHYAQKAKLLDVEVLASIEKIVNASTVVSVFIYDTTLDRDPTWVDKTGSQSYCLETLNTATRGATKSFPKLALIVAETDKITIYDATRADCPMWRVSISLNANILKAGVITSVFALNGGIYVVSSTGIVEMNFIGDYGVWHNSASKYIYNGNLAQGNDGSGYTAISLDSIISDTVNDIAITQDAYGNNIIYVATDGGLSRIAPDGSVSNWTDDSGAAVIVTSVTIDGGYVRWNTNSTVTTVTSLFQRKDIPLSDITVGSLNRFNSNSTQGWFATVSPIHHSGVTGNIRDAVINALAVSNSLTLLYNDFDDFSNSMIANITKDWNSGIMHGDIQVALSADILGVLADRSYKNKSFTGTYTTADVTTNAELKSFTPTITNLTITTDSNITNLKWWEKIAGVWVFEGGSSSVNVTGIGTTTLTILLGTEVALVRADSNTVSGLIDIETEEKRMFQEDAKVTLQGTSSDVKAVDHDETTDILTACAGDTVTKFNGLVVTESRTETVTAISTVNGKELTNA